MHAVMPFLDDSSLQQKLSSAREVYMSDAEGTQGFNCWHQYQQIPLLLFLELMLYIMVLAWTSMLETGFVQLMVTMCFQAVEVATVGLLPALGEEPGWGMGVGAVPLTQPEACPQVFCGLGTRGFGQCPPSARVALPERLGQGLPSESTEGQGPPSASTQPSYRETEVFAPLHPGVAMPPKQ